MNLGECFILKLPHFLRSCDSRNLNLNPLCTLENGPIPKLWMDQVRALSDYYTSTYYCTGEKRKLAQVKEVYQRKKGASLPDYIKGLSNPNREKYYDSLVKLQPEVNRLSILIILISFEDMDEASATYNAWEEDLATLNIFFGQETVMGESKDAEQQKNDICTRDSYF